LNQDKLIWVFRAFLVSYLLLYCAAVASGFLIDDPRFDSVFEAWRSLHPNSGAAWELWTALMIAYYLILLTSLIGLFLFWRGARWLVAVAFVLGHSIGHIVGLGPVVQTQISYNLESLATICLGAAIALSFVGSVSEKFQSRREVDAT
jgi:hypothetical protein